MRGKTHWEIRHGDSVTCDLEIRRLFLWVAQSPGLISKAFVGILLGEPGFNSPPYNSKVGGLEDFQRVWTTVFEEA